MLDRLVLRPGESPGSPHLGEDPDDWRAPSAPTDWRARTDGPARWLATLGVAFGFLLLVAPGVIASRQVADWRTGHRYRPAFAWALGALAAWVGVVTPLMLTEFRGAAAVLGVTSLPPLLLWAARD